MPKKPIVKFLKDGNLITIAEPSQRVVRTLKKTLEFTVLNSEHERGQLRMAPEVRNALEKLGPLPDFPTRYVFPAGFRSKCVRVLKAAGYRPMIKDLRKPDNPEVYEPQWHRLLDNGVTFKWMQRKILERLCAAQYGQIKCPPGYGKSFLIYCLTELHPKATFAISTHSVDVLDQIHKELVKRMPGVGMVTGAQKDFGRRVTCYSGKSIHHCPAPVDFFIVDEVHEFATDRYLSAVGGSEAFRFSKRFGFSANVQDRSDNADFALEGVFGPKLADLAYADCVRHNCVTQIEVQWRDCHMARDPSMGFHSTVDQERAAIWLNEYRNHLIANDARQIPANEQVLITVETIAHAMALKKLLPEFTMVYGHLNPTEEEDRRHYIDTGCITEDEPAMTLERRRMLKNQFEDRKLKRVIATGVWKRGVDFRALQWLIRADGRASPISDMQIPGRTSRISTETGKRRSVVIDYLDQFSDKWAAKAASRSRNYRKYEWEQVRPADAGRKKNKRRHTA